MISGAARASRDLGAFPGLRVRKRHQPAGETKPGAQDRGCVSLEARSPSINLKIKNHLRMFAADSEFPPYMAVLMCAAFPDCNS